MARERTMLPLAIVLFAACPNDPDGSTDSTQTLSPESTMTTAPSEESSSTTTDAGDDTTSTATSLTTAPSDDSSSSGGDASGCSVANPCELGYCVAPYADNDRGEFVCVPDCVMPGDEASWCFDDMACCDAEATCTERGYCVSPDDTTSSSSG